MKKVTLPKEVAKATESMRAEGMSDYELLRQAAGAVLTDTYLTVRGWAFEKGGGGTPELLMAALVNGYEIEKSSEELVAEAHEKVRQYHDEIYVIASNEDPGRCQTAAEIELGAIEKTLDLLGVKITGVNAP